MSVFSVLNTENSQNSSVACSEKRSILITIKGPNQAGLRNRSRRVDFQNPFYENRKPVTGYYSYIIKVVTDYR